MLNKMVKYQMSSIIPGTNLEGLVQVHHFHFVSLVLGFLRDLLDGLTDLEINFTRDSILVSCLWVILSRDSNTFGVGGKLGYKMVIVFLLELIDLSYKVLVLDTVNTILGVVIIFIMLELIRTT